MNGQRYNKARPWVLVILSFLLGYVVSDLVGPWIEVVFRPL